MAINPGATLNSVAAPTKQALTSNYIDFTADATAGWAQQYLPDLMEKEAEVFGNRTIAGFLSQVSAEEAMTSDQVVWSEQGRLHLSYQVNHTSEGVFDLTKDSDGNTITDHGVRVGDTVVITDAASTIKAYVSAIGTTSVTVKSYSNDTVVNAGVAVDATDESATMFVYGSEHGKGTTGRTGANAPTFKSFSNKPIILKDKYEVSGSDASAIGWIEVSGEEGQNGYYWYLKAEGDTRARFSDYLEMSCVESETAATGSGAIGVTGIEGSEGLFQAITNRGNITTGLDAGSATGDLADFDVILKEFDKQGAIEENMLFLNRDTALAVDDMLAGMNSPGVASNAGTSWGVFNNDADMALNLGFSGFRRGSYDFYKSDWKYLNDKSTRGGGLDAAAGDASNGLGAVRGTIIPAGVSSVYDQQLGKNIKRPFLHVRYRASQMEDRKMKTWTTGSVGAATSDLDAMEMHFLSERCLVVQGANNFMLIKG